MRIGRAQSRQLLAGLALLLLGAGATMLQHSLIISRSSSIWQSYCSQLRRRPLLTKAATGVVGSLIGDGVAQYTASRSRAGAASPVSYDAGRAARLCTYAALIGTPIGHYWFSFLDKFIFPGSMGHPVTAVVKTLLDQAIMAPAGIGLFFVAMSVLEGADLRSAWASCKEKFRPTLMANYALWPAANLVNFAFVPPAQRILYCNVVYVFWASFLSAMASKKGGGGEGGKPGARRLDPDLAQKEL